MEKISDYDDRVLVKTIDSERYGDRVDWKDKLRSVENYTIITGRDRKRFIARSIEDTQWYWEDAIPRLLNELLKTNKQLQKSKKYINTKEYILEWLEQNDDNSDQLSKLMELLAKN